MVEFTVFGNPKPQTRHRTHKFGTYDPSKKDKQDFYLQALRNKPKEPLSGRIFANIKFYMPRPKSHFRTGKYKNILKDNAPRYYQYKKPDIDNLIKFVADAIQGKDKFIIDDSMICNLRSEKIYSAVGDLPRTEVTLFALQE